ncbi:MAG: M28 family peptidase, partial [Gemmatimonadota bacterium]|nr:M28 family peptidase [Gemmatimonadota bacterium]MDH4348964.1 M28 family peptidase [Gemmatimonadota bacterium]MDH5282356.1 M28 family peptidase [Gemmatimonadota bacterium]
MNRLFAVTPLALSLATSGWAQTSPSARLAQAADSQAFRAHFEYLADDLLEGRAPATRGGELAAKYIAAQFRRLGLEPAGDSGSYFHTVPIVALTGAPQLLARGPGAVPLRAPDDYVLWSERNEPTVSFRGGAVFVGYGITAPEWEWDDYAGADVTGKLVFCLVNDPGLSNPAIFRGPILTYYGRWTYKIEEAARRGAAGIILIHTTESATYPWSTVVGSTSGERVRLEKAPSPLVVAGWMRDEAVGRLLRGAGLDPDKLMGDAGRKGFRAVSLPLEFDATVESAIRRSATANVVGRLPGRGPHAREAVMIGGHYDHLGIRAPVNGDSIYNGAEDNASGTAAVLAAAEAFVRSGTVPGRSLLFMAFGAEESGLLGSEAFAERPTLPLADLAAVLNLDVMNLYGPTTDIAATGADHTSLGRTLATAARAEGLTISIDSLALVRGSFFRSDHFPLVRRGVPALSMEQGRRYADRPAGWGEERKQEYITHRYHKPQDEVLPWYSYQGPLQQLRVALRVALEVANAPSQPVWGRDSEFRVAGEARVGPKPQ